MTKSYHLTQEQVLEIARRTGLSPIMHGISDSVAKPVLKDFANAVLDQVLGEPVAYLVDGRIEQGLFFDKLYAEIMADANCGKVKSLYAPKEQL